MSNHEAHDTRLLLVEDEALIALSEKKTLENYGYEVITAYSGEQAVEIATENTDISLVLMDIDLGSGIDGTEAARQILKMRSLPIVFLTGHSEKEYVDRVKKITSYGYILKNSGEFVLIESVEMAFTLYEANDELKRQKENLQTALVQQENSEQALQIHVQRYEQLFDNIDSCVAVYEPTKDATDFVVVDMNKAAENTEETRKENIIGKKVTEVFPAVKQFGLLDVLKEVERTGTPESLPLSHYSDGRVAGWRKNYVYKLPSGEIVAVYKDVTERKELEDALTRKTEFLQRVTENIGDVVGITDLSGTFTYHTDFPPVTGYERGDLVGKNVFDFIHPDDLEYVQSAFREFIAYQQEKRRVEYRLRCADGSYIWMETNGTIIKDEEGHTSELLYSTREITERKQVEDALAQKTKLLERSQVLANLGSWEWDMVHDAWHFSEEWKKIHGLSDNDLATARLLEIAHPDDAPDIEKAFTDAREHGKTYDIEHRIIRADDKEIRHIKALGEAEFDQETGRPVRMVGASQDITERKLAQEETQKQLSEKETLLREVHHRVKNNIAQIESLLSLQAGSTANAEVKAALQDAVSRVQSMRVLYDKLLLSKDLGEISIKNYAEGLIDSLVMAFDSGKNITIEKHISDFEINARKAISIGIIINELLTNVFKYAFKDRDSGMVSASIDKEENNVTLIIQDNGVGIDERAVENKSPGFGLTIVKMLVEQLGGTSSIVNENGAKSVVQFEI